MSDFRIYTELLAAAKSVVAVIERVARHDADLARQMRRAFTSIALNMAEGSRLRDGNARLRFRSAMGSADEVRAGIEIAVAMGYLDGEPELIDLLRKVAQIMDRLGR